MLSDKMLFEIDEMLCYNESMKTKLYNTSENKKDRCVVIVAITSNKENKERKLDEITRLAESTDLEVVSAFLQNVKEFNRSTIIGSGKVQEIKAFIEENDIDLAIVDYKLTGSQARNLSNELGVRVLDRIGLILDIFAKRAQSAEAKLQVKLAQSRYLLPRLAEVKETSNRYGGGSVGMRGPGETKLELDRRVLEKEIDRLRKDILQVKEKRKVNRREREKNGIKRVALVGYTNAGKSSLLNVLAKENIYAEDKYFATLDTTSRKAYLKEGKTVLITDTVGFISDLPHELVDAFSATLEESADADLILHVVDPNMTDVKGENLYYQENIRVTNQVLDEVGATKNRILVYNKVDLLSRPIEIEDNLVLISAKTGKGIEKLKDIIYHNLFE